MNYKAPRGTHDIWGKEAEKLHRLEETCRAVFRKYDFSELRTPTFEDAALFIRSIGETTDIVEKEMYVFEDRKGRKLALRPEGTASVVRAYLENQLASSLPVGKLFYLGPMFRYERPQAGRYREFYQIGAEYFANPSPLADAEVILLARDVLSACGLKEISIRLHTLGCSCCRPSFRKVLTDYLTAQKDLCPDCLRRVAHNPLRVLDCKIDGAKLENLPRMIDVLCADCHDHFDRVQKLLSAVNCSFTVDPRLVRGIDYYTRTIFEVRSSYLGSQDALAAGGRYDNLVQELGGGPTPAVGFALGAERVLMAAERSGAMAELEAVPTVLVAVAGTSLEAEAFRLAAAARNLSPSSSLRKTIFADAPQVCVEGPFPDRSLKSQLRLADRIGADKVIIFAEEEFRRGSVIVRNMKTQHQEEILLKTLE